MLNFLHIVMIIYFLVDVNLFSPDLLNGIEQQTENAEISIGQNHLSEANILIERDSLAEAEKLLTLGMEWADEMNDLKLLTDVYFAFAKLRYKNNDFEQSLNNYRAIIHLSEENKDTLNLVKALSSASRLFNELGIVDSAFEYCESELQINKRQKNYILVADNFRRLYTYTRYTLGGISESEFVTTGYLDSSLVYAIKSKDIPRIVYSMSNYAIRTYVDDPEKGRTFIQAAIDSARQLPLPNKPLVYALMQSYNVYWNEGSKKRAENNLLEALPMAKHFNNPVRLAHIYWLLGTIEKSKKHYDDALFYLRKAVYFGDKTEVSPLKRSIYTVIRRVFKEMDNADSTLFYLEKYTKLTDKVHNEAMNKQLSLLSARFKVKEKENQIELLDELNRQKVQEIDLQRQFIITLSASIIIVIVLLIVLSIQYKKTQKAYLILTRKTLEINKQQNEIIRLNGERRKNIINKLEPIKLKLASLFEDEKIFLDKNLNLQTVASLLDTNTTYLSTLINSSYRCNFTQFVNKYRVLEACEIMGDKKNNVFTIEAIADMSGFISKSTFNKAFKDVTGLTPSVFKENIQQK